ncbi:MAG: glycosyltransferase family A protein [Prolixibacteraceae bacterium]
MNEVFEKSEFHNRYIEPVTIIDTIWDDFITPMVSICCLTYNHEAYIKDAINGFLIQKTTFKVEIFIHDDASTDGTAEIVRDFADKYPDVIFPILQTENQYSKGVGPLTNYVFPRARGKYIALCEGDDYWTDPLKLQKQVEFLEENEEYVAVAENGLVKNSITNEQYLFSEEPERDVSIQEMVFRRRFPTASVVFRSKTLNNFSNEVKQANDTILWCYLASKGKFRYFVNVSSVYRRGNHGLVEGTNKFQWAQIVERWNNELIRLFGGKHFNKQIAIDAIWLHYWDVYYKRKYSSLYEKYFSLFKCFDYNWKKIFLKMISRQTNSIHKGFRAFARILIREQSTRIKIEKFYRRFFPKKTNRITIPLEFYKIFRRIGINEDPRSPKLIVTLTSYPPRIKTLHLSIKTLLNQTVKPDILILWLAKSQFPRMEEDLPRKLLRLRKYGLTINWCEDLKSYKKLIPALQLFPDDILVTADDDLFYPKDWLGKLYNAYVKDNSKIYCHRMHRILFSEHKEILPYRQWDFCSQNNSVSCLNFITTGGGAIYPPRSFHPDVLKHELFQDLAPHADDIWFWAMAVLNDTKIQLVEGNYSDPIIVYGSQKKHLGELNYVHGGNDKQLNQILNHYPDLFNRLMDAAKDHSFHC